MSSSKNKFRNIIILAIVLAALIGLYFVINATKSEPPEPEEEKITIFETEKNKIKEITIDNNEKKFTFIKDNDNWKVESLENIKLLESKIDSLAYDIASIYAEQIIEENPEDMEVYGFKNPKSIVTVKLEDGTTKQFQVGNPTPSKAKYYFKDSEKNTVYTVYSYKAESFLSNLEKYRDRTIFTLNPEEINSFSFEGSNREKVTVKLKDENDTSGTISPWKMIVPYKIDVNGEKVSKEILQNLSKIQIKDFIDDDPKNFAKYGLDNPTYVIEFTDKNNNNFKMHLGNTKNNVYYMKVNDDKAVYTIDAGAVSYKDIDAFDLIDKFAYIVNIDNVDKIVVNYENKQTTLEIIHKGEDETDYKVNGNPAGEDPFKKTYQEIIGLIIDGVMEEEIEGRPEINYTFYHNDGTDNVTVKFVSLDDRNYAVFKNGKSEFYIKKKKVRKMIEKLEEFVQDPIKEE